MRLCLSILLILLATGSVSFRVGAEGGERIPMKLSSADQNVLFQVARAGIKAHLEGKTPPPPAGVSPALCEPRGVFVTLTRSGRLRGCIGYLDASKPLIQAVQEMAAAAAFQDPRFPPLRADELADLVLEISILSPMQPVEKVENIQVGKHGLYIIKGLSRGLLLPQVATEYGWDRLTFLQQTCSKAGLPPDAWKTPDARLYSFTAEILSESHK